MSYAPSTSKRFSSKRKRMDRGVCCTRIRWVVSSGTGSRSRSWGARTAMPRVGMSRQSRKVLRQVGGRDGHGQPVAELVGAHGDAAREHELPEPQILEADGVEAAVLEQARADVDLVVHAVGLLLLEVVREHGLRRQLLVVEVRGDRLGNA